MNLSFREKSLWIDLAATLGIAAYYASNLLGFSADKHANIYAVMDLLGDVVMLCIFVSVTSWAVLNAHDKKSAEAPLDEREFIAELKASRYGFWLLQIGIAIAVVFFGLVLGGDRPTPITAPPFASLHTLVISLILAEVLVTSIQLWGLRRDL